MEIWLFYLFIAIMYAIVFLALRRQAKQKSSDPKCPFSDKENPFNLWKMQEQLKCKKCGRTWIVVFKRFDYIFQKIIDKRAKHKAKKKDCDGEVIVSGIWYEYRDESPAEKKWKDYEKRWR
jgi:hypothetical protein